MAKKKVRETNVRPGYRSHATQRCEREHCMGKPKELIDAKTFDGTLCAECNLVHEYKRQETIDAQEKLELKEEKVKTKTLKTSEADIEKLIEEADKKEKKKVKKQPGEQSSLF